MSPMPTPDARIHFKKGPHGEWDVTNADAELLELLQVSLPLLLTQLFAEPTDVATWLEGVVSLTQEEISVPLVTELRLFALPVLLWIAENPNLEEGSITVALAFSMTKIELIRKMSILATLAEESITQSSLELTLAEKNLRHFKHWLLHFIGTIRLMTQLKKNDKAILLLDQINDYFIA
jgi:hypothetical protein